jgi:hypothetical protein
VPRPRVVEDVRVLGRRVRQRERDGDGPGAPRPEERGGEGGSGRREDRDPLPLERSAPREEGRGDPFRRREEAAVRRAPARVDDGGPFPVRADPLEEAQRSKISLEMISRWIWLVPS